MGTVLHGIMGVLISIAATAAVVATAAAAAEPVRVTTFLVHAVQNVSITGAGLARSMVSITI